jgi:hypothetical protein
MPSRRRRPPWARRPTVENKAQAQALGSQARAGPSRASICVQAVSSQAMATSSHQICSWQAVQREVAQAGVLGGADAVLAARPPAVAQFQVRELAGPGVGGEAGEAVPADAGEAQLGAGVGCSLRTITRIPSGHDDRSSRPVSSATHAPGRTSPPRVMGRFPDPLRQLEDRLGHVVGDGHAHRVLQPPLCEPGQELMGAAAGIGADQHAAAQPSRQLRERQPAHLDVLAAVFDPALPGRSMMPSASPSAPPP